MTPAQIREQVRKSRAAAGLPEHVQGPILAELAAEVMDREGAAVAAAA
jgi:hypothetical protein